MGEAIRLSKKQADTGGFDVVMEAVRKQNIWDGCPHFLKQHGPHVSVCVGFEAWSGWRCSSRWRQIAGNVRCRGFQMGGRRYVHVASTVDGKGGCAEKICGGGVVKRCWGARAWDDAGEVRVNW